MAEQSCPMCLEHGAAASKSDRIRRIITSDEARDMLTMTDSAVTQLRQILSKDASNDKALRVYVTPGGCSGFSYGMSLDDERSDDDQVFTIDGVQVVVDAF